MGKGGERQRGCQYKMAAICTGSSFEELGKRQPLLQERDRKSPAKQQHKVAVCRTRRHSNQRLCGLGTVYPKGKQVNDTCPPASNMHKTVFAPIRCTAAVVRAP